MLASEGGEDGAALLCDGTPGVRTPAGVVGALAPAEACGAGPGGPGLAAKRVATAVAAPPG
eukprot:7208823-Heterocapsa_arctica.AAC.1